MENYKRMSVKSLERNIADEYIFFCMVHDGKCKLPVMRKSQEKPQSDQ